MSSKSYACRSEVGKVTLTLVTAHLLVLSWAIVSARVIVRIRDKTWGADDWLMAIGQHLTMGGPLQHDLIAQILYALTSIPIRASLCASLLRIAQERTHKIILWSIIPTSFISAAVMIAGALTKVSPIRAIWDIDYAMDVDAKFQPPRYQLSFLLTFTGLAVAQDLIVAGMPVVLLWNLHKSRAERIRLMLLLGLGASAAVALLVRIYFLIPQVYAKHQKVPIFICTIFELGVAIVGGSLAALRKAIKEWWEDVTDQEWQKLRSQSVVQSPAVSKDGIEVPATSAGSVNSIRRGSVPCGGRI
ncbi:hypothetical protein K458DRAFT_403840 [Lentithecium fluviatile CBS 122367]|uniref:Rhodopsin domain-containing protein n=1 Tax=Lentithecium fluviatile CBS 122367 TaxID=1168545 RepID=A0A6G1J2Z9_9PLEO|nr:hypothetical protein K458DRAFT_403840 [Lentithecium fluviatile CBS 122367]